MGYSQSILGVFTGYSYVSVMYRLCVGYVSVMYRLSVGTYLEVGGECRLVSVDRLGTVNVGGDGRMREGGFE